MEDRFGHERRRHVRRQQLLGLRSGAAFQFREYGALLDAGVDALLEDARRFFLRERHDAGDEVAAGHRPGMERDELIEEQHGEAALLLLGFRGRGWDDRGDVGFGPRAHAREPAARPPLRLGDGDRRLVDLRVVGAQSAAGPPGLGNQILKQKYVVAQVRRVTQLVRERAIAGDEVDVLVFVLDGFAEGVEVAVTRDDEPHLEVGPFLVQQLQGACDEDRIASALEEAAAHALGDRDGLHSGEFERHEQRVVLRGDLLSEDRELDADRPELRGLLQDRLQDRKRGWQRAGGVLAQGVVDVLPVNEESDVRQ
jgi:hypothetical protein